MERIDNEDRPLPAPAKRLGDHMTENVTRHPDLLAIDEAAAYLGQGSRWLYDALRRGEVPGARIGNKWVLSRRRLDEWIDERFSA